jgi:hypothetical protein
MKTLLFEAVVAGSSKQLQLLLAQSRRIVAGGFELPADLDVNCADRTGVTPLHAAVLKGNLQMVKVLLEAGADCLCADSLGQSPLDVAQSKQSADIVHAMHSHLSALRAKSPKPRPSLQLSSILSCAPAAEAAAISAPAAATACSSWSRNRDMRSRPAAGAEAPPCAQLLRALSVSSVKKKPAVAVAHAASPSAPIGQPMSGGGAAGAHMQPAVHVPRDAVLDFKLWMKQKQAATAATTSLTPLSEVPEAIAEDDEVCAVNRHMDRRVLRTAAAKRPAPLHQHQHQHRPITPTVYGGSVRCASMTPVASSDSAEPSAPSASLVKVGWLHAPPPLPPNSNSSARLSALQARSELARISGRQGASFAFASKFPPGRAAEDLPQLPSSFLPRELDPLEAVRVQEQRQLAALQHYVTTFEQEERSMTPAAFKKLKRRILGASACAEDVSSPLATVGDALHGSEAEAARSSSAPRPRPLAPRLRRLVL